MRTQQGYSKEMLSTLAEYSMEVKVLKSLELVTLHQCAFYQTSVKREIDQIQEVTKWWSSGFFF